MQVGSASQGYHTDYAHSQVGHLHGTPWYPRSAIWAALAAFEIGTRDGLVIRVPRDHVIFFMADFWHCGGPGLSPEPRFHGFQLASWTQIVTDRCVYVDAIHCIVRVSHMYRECIGKHYACIELSDT
jgi:hypothetical protein